MLSTGGNAFLEGITEEKEGKFPFHIFHRYIG